MALACLIFICALLSKESAIVFPALAVVCLFYLRASRWNYKTYLITLPFWLIAFGYLLARKTFLNFENTFQFYKVANLYTENILFRCYTFLATLPSYLEIVAWPVGLHMDRSFPVFVGFFLWPVILGFCILALAGYVIWKERGARNPIWSFGILWFLAAHVPHMGILLPVNSFFLEHWLYLPSIGLIICVGDWLSRQQLVSPVVVRSAVAGVAIVLGILTFMQNRVWDTPISFSDEYPQTHHNLALALVRKKRIDEAIKHLERALELDKDFYHSSTVLAEIYHQMGMTPLAEAYSKRAAESYAKFAR